MNEILEAALQFADRGWKVFPLDGKEPFEGSNGWHDGTTSRKRIRAWWDETPEANIGIVCDSKGGPIVVDIDAPKDHELDGFKYIRKHFPGLEDQTRTARSRSGRLHLYFDPMVNGSTIKRIIRPFRNGDNKKVAIDILGDGGYVVAPPSIHPDTQRPYRWLNEIELTPFPKTLLRHLNKRSVFNVAPPLPDVVREGERDTVLTSLAGTMRRRNASPEAILEALRVENNARVRPPLSDRQLRKIALSIGRKKPLEEEELYTDQGNARRFVNMNQKKVRAIFSQRRRWVVYSGQRWESDSTGETERMAKLTIRQIYREADDEKDEEKRAEKMKFALQSQSAHALRALLELAGSEPEIMLTPNDLDADPWLLNVENGTINLRTGELQPHKRSDYITKLAPVTFDPNAEAPRWNQFLHEVLREDEELVSFVRRAIGYSLTGDIREHCLFFCYGKGRNGKSTFIEVIREMLGEYASQSDFTSFQTRRGEGPRNDMARLRGARFVSAIEAQAEKDFDAAVIKQITGGDAVVARKLYEEFFEFKPQFKLWLAANHKPVVKEQTEAFWSRMRLIPFTVTIPPEKRKKNLINVLRAELPGILNWAIAGCLEWQAQKGLHPPERVMKATKEYQEEHDTMGEFLAACCEMEPHGWTTTAQLYEAFRDWWNETRGQRSTPLSLIAFTRMLSERADLRARKRANTRGWLGITIRNVNTQ